VTGELGDYSALVPGLTLHQTGPPWLSMVGVRRQLSNLSIRRVVSTVEPPNASDRAVVNESTVRSFGSFKPGNVPAQAVFDLDRDLFSR
jgi:hypothetical protein